MAVCPFCKATTATSHGPCAKCGKVAADHPSIAGSAGRTLSNDFEDDDGGDFVLGTGSAGSGDHSAAYGGGGVDLDTDFLEDEPQGDLELDLPPGTPAVRLQAPQGGVPDLDVPPPKPSSSARAAASAPPSSTRGVAVSAPPSSNRAVPSAAPSSGRSLPAAAPSQPEIAAQPPAPEPPNHAATIAKYPAPPHAIWQAPVYAIKVILRQFELRQDLESLRRRRSPDVPLYEAALRAYEKKSFNVGLAMTIAMLTLATFIFFLPVIIRFIRAPD